MSYHRFTSLLFLFVCCLAFAAAGKKPIVLTLPITDSLVGTVSFCSVTVIDARKNKSNLGISSAKRQAFITASNIEDELSKLVMGTIKNATNKGEQDLRIEVYNLELKDYVLAKPLISTVHIGLACYLEQHGKYAIALRLDSLYEMPVAKDAVTVLPLVVSQIISSCTKQVAITDAQSLAYDYTLAQIETAVHTGKQQLPIYNQAYKKGVYYTYHQFVNNSPADTLFYDSHYYTGSSYVYKFYLPGVKNKKGKDLSDTTCYAVYDGERWFKPYTKNDFTVMKMVDGVFTYNAIHPGLKLDDYSALNGLAYSHGLLGGLVGGAVASAKNNKQLNAAPIYDDALFRVIIDPLTGQELKQERIR